MQDFNKMTIQEYLTVTDMTEVQHKEVFIGKEWLDIFISPPIFDCKNQKLDISEMY